jgi:hypothetical protein
VTCVDSATHHRTIAAVIAAAEYRFDVLGIDRASPGSDASDARLCARQWVIRTLHARHVPVDRIAAALATSIGVVRVALGLPALVDTDLDDDERVDAPVRGPIRMLPVIGDRRDCAHASACLGELLRAAAPSSPRAASCPLTCSLFAPPGRPERAAYDAGLGSWNEANLPDLTDIDDAARLTGAQTPQRPARGRDRGRGR